MKKVILYVLMLSMILSMGVPASASRKDDLLPSSRTEFHPNNDYIDHIDDVKIYLTRISEKSLLDNYSLSDESIDFDRLLNDIGSEKIDEKKMSVKTLSFSELRESTNPIIQRAYSQLLETYEKGMGVHAINIILPNDNYSGSGDMKNMTKSGSDDPNDPAFWYNNSIYWGTYQGQDIRYTYTSFSISKPKTDVANRPSNWPGILGAVVKVGFERWVETTLFDTVYKTISDIQSVLGSAVPLNYTIDPTTEWVKAETVGTLTYRDVFLEDIDNIVSGYAYYLWGSLQSIQFQTRIEVKYYAGYYNGAPYYPVVTSPYSNSQFVNSRYFNNSMALFPILRQYYDSFGYTIYTERLDISSILF